MTSPPPWVAAHEAAMAAGEARYVDPDSGYSVFTEHGLRARGRCCGCACRHCPWAHESVPASARAARIQQPAMLHKQRPAGKRVAVLFHSGGKDSYLALRATRREHPELSPVWLTTFDAQTRIVAHQELAIETIVGQAQALDVALLGVPLVSGADYAATVGRALALLAAASTLDRFVFGDLHLETIRRWREEQLGPLATHHGATMSFPLWERDYAGLFAELEESGVEVRICAAPNPEAIAPLTVGDRFDRRSAARLPETTDRFGEAGEFHTEVLAASLDASS